MNGNSFLISDFSTGLYEAKEPWLSPADAFQSPINAYIRRGILQKRLGRSVFAKMNHYVAAISGITKADPGVVTTVASHGLSNGDTVILYDVSGMTEVNGEEYTVANKTADTFELSGTDTSGFTTYTSGGKVGKVQTNSITGIKEFTTASGTKTLLVFDTKRVAKYNTTNEVLEDIAESDIFTGDAEDLFWTTNWGDKIYFTNNVDRIKTWDGSSLATPTFDIDGDASNEVDTCLCILPFKERLLLFRTTEDGTVYRQRVRWSGINDPTSWDDTITGAGGYIDAPTDESIISVETVDDGVAIRFTNSWWVLRFTGDIDVPFLFDKIGSTIPECKSTHSIFSNNGVVFTHGFSQIVGTNGSNLMIIDQQVPDVSLKVDQEKNHILYSQKYEEYEQIWIAYTKVDSTTNDRILVYNYRENTWSIYDHPLTCMGITKTLNDTTWDSESRTWNEITEAWDDFALQASFPIVLGGKSNGLVVRMQHGSVDEGSDIDFDISSSRWNPYASEGKRAKLMWIDFLVSADDTNSVSIDFFVDFDSSSYQTSTLNFTSDFNTADKVWKRLESGAIGSSHRIQISHTESNQTPKFHAFVLHFKPQGRIRQ